MENGFRHFDAHFTQSAGNFIIALNFEAVKFEYPCNMFIARRLKSTERESLMFLRHGLLGRRCISQLFCPRTHVVLTQKPKQSLDAAPIWVMGLTRYAQESMVLGDVDSVAITRSNGVEEVGIKWSGLQQSGGDELYHVVWQNVNGVMRVALPPNVSVSARVPPAADLDAVVELTGDISKWTGLVTSEDEYNKIAS